MSHNCFHITQSSAAPILKLISLASGADRVLASLGPTAGRNAVSFVAVRMLHQSAFGGGGGAWKFSGLMMERMDGSMFHVSLSSR